MEKAVYIHGLGGSGTGSSAKNIKTLLSGLYDVQANTYDLLDPLNAFKQIKKDCRGARLIIASSLGGFYASALDLNYETILLNPCLNPCKSIPEILTPEQEELFDKEKCLKEWDEIADKWTSLDEEAKAAKFGVFSDNDEYFSYLNTFIDNFETSYGHNFCKIHGTHEIAKDREQTVDAISQAWDYFNIINDSKYDLGYMYESRLREAWLNMFFNSGDPRQEAKIDEYIADVWDLLDAAYSELAGGAGSLRNLDEFIADCEKSNAMIKCYKSNGKIIAAAVYNLNRGGRKLSLIGADKTSENGKKWLYRIMNDDISKTERQFWAEVSDGAEVSYYFKTNAMPIDPDIVERKLQKDGFTKAGFDRSPIRQIKDKNTGEIIASEPNRFSSGYYQRPIVGAMHRKVAIASPENVDNIEDFSTVRYKKDWKKDKQ